ncbi:MAG: hypothetical protein Q7S22_08990 [Candidatus Micrarchaeota archaeon]|nr:hypothetical protein [Candidatus Micrarchaeota archaeon]
MVALRKSAKTHAKRKFGASDFFRLVPPKIEGPEDVKGIRLLLERVISTTLSIKIALMNDELSREECLSEAFLVIFDTLHKPDQVRKIKDFDAYFVSSIRIHINHVLRSRMPEREYQRVNARPHSSARAAAVEMKDTLDRAMVTRIYMSELSAMVQNGAVLTPVRRNAVERAVREYFGEGDIPRSERYKTFRARRELRRELDLLECEGEL